MKKVLILANSSKGVYGFRNELVLKMLHEYEKIGVYYYNDNKTDLDKLCAHCEKLSSQCAGKKLTILVYLIDSFAELLQSTKEDNQQ